MTPSNRPVLVVDDDRSTRLILASELESAGYRPVLASTGAEAIEAMAATRCRIVITDWLMPDLDGLALCRRIRSDAAHSGAHLIMITVNNDKSNLLAAFEAGVDDFLPKPFEPGVLLARMRAAIRAIDLHDELAARNAELESANQRLALLATTDELTGLPNRRHGLARLRERWAEAGRQDRPLAAALVDIDHFKRFNDTYGHMIGDRVLADVAEILRRSCRGSDAVCRYGGEEFLFVLPDTGLEGALGLAGRWRDAIARHCTVEGPLALRVTVSIGVATRSSGHAGEMDLVRAADDALYAAKEAGRNTVRQAA